MGYIVEPPKVFGNGERLFLSYGPVINGKQSFLDIGMIAGHELVIEDCTMADDVLDDSGMRLRGFRSRQDIRLTLCALDWNLHEGLDLRDINRSVAEKLTVRELFGVIDKKIEERA